MMGTTAVVDSATGAANIRPMGGWPGWASPLAYVSDGSRHAKVDLSAVSFMDSSGLGFLVCVRISRSRGGLVTLSRPQATVLRPLRTTHLDQLFEIEV